MYSTNVINVILDNTGSCYYGADIVRLLNGSYRQIDQLKVGDRLWTLAKDGRTLIEDEMILMMIAETNASSKFLLSEEIYRLILNLEVFFIH